MSEDVTAELLARTGAAHLVRPMAGDPWEPPQIGDILLWHRWADQTGPPGAIHYATEGDHRCWYMVVSAEEDTSAPYDVLARPHPPRPLSGPRFPEGENPDA